MWILGLLSVALAQDATTPPQEQAPPQSPPNAESSERITLDTISLTGTRPVPEVQIIIQRPDIPIHSTEQILQEIDERLEKEDRR